MLQKKIDNIWHIYSNGSVADIPFGPEENKVYLWNSLALCSCLTGVRILVATINDTHFHLLAFGDSPKVDAFANSLFHRLRKVFRRDRIDIASDPVYDRTEILGKFMYVYRNCLDFYKKLPWEYPWGSGNIYFSEKKQFFRGTPVGKTYGRIYRMLFKTHKKMPPEWLYDEKGKILPECFIDYEAAEELFGSARAWIAFLYVKKEDEARIKQDINRRYLEHRSIMDLRKQGNIYCRNICKKSLVKAPFNIRLQVAIRMIKEGLSGRNASLAKALYLTPEDLIRLT